MSKITKATFKSFIRKNEGKLFIKVGSSFDGMSDCVMPVENAQWAPLEKSSNPHENNLGYAGVWLVGGSGRYGNSFEPIQKDGFKGIRVYNCCGSFTVGVPA